MATMGRRPLLVVAGIVLCCVFIINLRLFSAVTRPQHNADRSVRPRGMPAFDKAAIEKGAVNSLAGTTGTGVPGAMRKLLLSTGKPIDDDAQVVFGSEEAVRALEARCGWDPAESHFKDKDCLRSVGFSDAAPHPVVSPDLVDIVTPSIRDLHFLNDWREFFQGFHVIIVQDGDPDKYLNIPDWVDYELYNRHDIEAALGEDAWIISSRDASIRNFGFLVSRKQYIYTIDDDCLPATDADGFQINPLHLHLRNLQTPSTPYFFNTLYDPYESNADFVRGYPYSLRGGVPTAVSHGIWLNAPDYDAPTQLLKPQERNGKLVDATITVPHGIYYPMCSMNVAFSRELIGPAFMQGLMGVGQPWARYDDMFAGWASKAVADHLGVGVKSGQPYIRHNKASNPFTNLRKEFKGLWWQEDIIRFFTHELQLSPSSDTPVRAYIELAAHIRRKFGEVHDYFNRLATAMTLWAQAWTRVASGELTFKPSRKSVPGIAQKFPVVNTGARSVARYNDPAHLQRAPVVEALWPRRQRVVTMEDVQVGHSFNTYMYPLPDYFHKDVLDKYNVHGCLTHTCFGHRLRTLPAQYEDYEAEIIIMTKLLASLRFVSNPADADLILVPALPVTAINPECRNSGPCMDEWYTTLMGNLTLLESGKPHLFIASQDTTENHRSIVDLMLKPRMFVASYGPFNLVTPSLNVDLRLQPRHFQGPIPLAQRSVFAAALFGVRHPDRVRVMAELQAYNGSRVVVSNFLKGHGKLDPNQLYERSIFVLCLSGDLPYQKRMYDALLAVSIPVVVARARSEGVSYWNPKGNKHAEKFANLGLPLLVDVSRCYPDETVMGLRLRDLVVEVPGEVIEAGRLMPFLEAIPADVIQQKLAAIAAARNMFVYDFEGSTRDAFSVMLDTLRTRLAALPSGTGSH